jgi:nicotinate-nucleotide adenylyltransferase
MEHVPVGVLARPGRGLSAGMSPAAMRYRRWRLPAREAGRLCRATPPAWCFVTLPMKHISSSEIRARGEWR